MADLRKLLIACFVAIASNFVHAEDPALEAHVNKVAEQLRCLVCQNQSIAESQADLANDLRREVREMLAAGKSEQDVIDFMVARYGDFVLYDPPMKATTLLLWAGPVTLLLAALGGFTWTVRQRRRSTQPLALDQTDAARAQALLQDPTE